MCDAVVREKVTGAKLMSCARGARLGSSDKPVCVNTEKHFYISSSNKPHPCEYVLCFLL